MSDDERWREAGSAVLLVRNVRGKKQDDVERETGISQSYLSDVERGKQEASTAILTRIAESFDIPLSTLAVAGAFIRWVRAAGRSVGQQAGDAALELACAQEGAAEERLSRESAALVLGELRRRAQRPAGTGAAARDPDEARRQAAALWNRLAPRPAVQRRAILAELPEFWSADLVTLLYEESEQARADSPARAVELAELALEVVHYLPGGESVRDRARARGGALVDKARRSAGSS
ncbi:MAG TPA: helix-turn-helix transcriptional regulator [Thermoanaerobaculia bacterium]|nr:helix-turn-helix transcriptional regulator [Thermoanaerobaculia bacterium]